MITVVSGLPRSGTSLMMQMLTAGGITPLSDGERKPDLDNPRGYLEWERAKRLPSDPACIRDAEGKVVKVISHLLLSLPDVHEYRIVFMQRPLPEVLASQDTMLQRRSFKQGANAAIISAAFGRHLKEVYRWIDSRPNVRALPMPYHQVLGQPQESARAIAHFLEMRLNLDKMVGQVDSSLYRNRGDFAARPRPKARRAAIAS